MPSNPRVFMDVRIGNEDKGRMEFELFADTTPRTAENFRCLCTGEQGISKRTGRRLAYKNSIFHRIIPGFMAQGGDFENADGTGGESIYGKTFGDENFLRKHIGPGMLSMANCGKNTNGSQFFITFKTTSHLNGKHVVFGRLVKGMDVLRALESVHTNRDRPVNDCVIFNCGEVGKAPIFIPSNDKVADAKKNPDVQNDEEIDLGEDDDSDSDGEQQQQQQQGQDTQAEAQKDVSEMTPRERKLFELRLRLNKARKDNKREAREEHARFNSKKNPSSRRKEFLEKKEQWEKEMKERGEEHELFMYETAESVGYRDKKKSKKKQASFGWEVFNQDAQYNAYKKRLEETRKNEDHDFRDPNSLDYFEAHQPSEHDVDRMVGELKKTQERRSKFSRRRPHYEGQDIDSINDRNAVFNKKIKRAYDKCASYCVFVVVVVCS